MSGSRFEVLAGGHFPKGAIVQLTRGLAGVVAVALLNGCDGKVVMQFPPGPVIPRQNVAGALPPSANDTATGFYEFMQTVNWSGKKTVEMCTNSFLCFFGGGKVKVDLDVPQNSYLVDTRAVPGGGAILARAVNKGHDATGHYNFRPGYIYTLVGYPDSPGATTSHWILKETDTTTHHTITVPGIQGPHTPCGDAPPATIDEVNLYKCGEAHTSGAIGRADMGLFSFMNQLMAVLGGESPVWKSCPSGCCTLAQAQ
jgi:hypothetical protein